MTSFTTSPSIVVSWRDGSAIADNFHTRETAKLSDDSLIILQLCAAGASIADLHKDLSESGYDVTTGDVEAAVSELVRGGLLAPTGETSGAAWLDQESWSNWGTEAAYFHLATKDAPYIEQRPDENQYVDSILNGKQPALFKRYPAAPHIYLERPHASATGEAAFLDVLRTRRTQREYSTTVPLKISDLSATLHYAFAPMHFIDAGPFGVLAMRNYASAGARGELEVYLSARGVAGLADGLYHYEAVSHALEEIGPGLTQDEAMDLTYHQPMCGDASVLFFLTAVVDRMGHKYRNPRALRAVYMNAGHAGQTFGLVATALGLAPCQTAAFKDTQVEARLGVDGLSETALYCLGLGMPTGLPPVDMEPAGQKAGARTQFFSDHDV